MKIYILFYGWKESLIKSTPTSMFNNSPFSKCISSALTNIDSEINFYDNSKTPGWKFAEFETDDNCKQKNFIRILK